MRDPERVRVYEKIHTGIWSYNGVFHLVDSWQERDTLRSVFNFAWLQWREGKISLSHRCSIRLDAGLFQPRLSLLCGSVMVDALWS